MTERFFSLFIKYIYSKKNMDFLMNDEHRDLIFIGSMKAIIRKNGEYEDNVAQNLLNCFAKMNLSVEMLFPPVPSNKLKKFTGVLPHLKNEAHILPINPYKFKEKKTFGLRFVSSYILNTTYSEAKSALQTYMELFKKRKPRLIVLYNETGALRYPAVVAAKKLGIPVVAIQHGIIYHGHPSYFHIPDNIAQDDDYINYVLPDKTCVYGNYEKKLLETYGSFPSEKIVVTGAPRYDALFKKSSERKDDILNKYGIPKGKKYLLWATQTHDKSMSKSGENLVNADNVFSQMVSMKEWHLIIKLHPGENQKAKLYRKMSKKYGLNITIIGRDADTYELLRTVDAVLIKNSTVGMEAVFAGKPVLLLNLVKSHSLKTYTDYGLGLVINEGKDIKNILKEISDEKFGKEFEKRREHFMYERCANAGKATKAVCTVIENALRRKK